MRMVCGVLTAVVFLASCGLQAQTSAPASAPAAADPLKIGASAYERMDPTKLVEYLSELGIGTLVDEYRQELQATDPLNAKYAQAELIIMQARDVSDPVKYLAQLDKAIALLKEVVAASSKPAEPYALLRSYRYRMHLADTMGNAQILPYVEKLLFLQAGDEDRKVVVDRTEEAVAAFTKLCQNVRDKFSDLATTPQDKMAIGNDLEELETALVYKSAFAYFYRGLALTDADEKSKKAKADCLRSAMTAVEKFTSDAENETGMKYRALLLSGQCSREMKEWQRASDLLKGASADGADPTTRLRANFEIGRMLAEKGDSFDAAKAQVDAFQKLAKDTFGKAGEVTADIQTAFLKSYLYEQWAASLRKTDAAKAGEMDALAQKALMDFINAHPDAASAFSAMIAGRYVGQDPKNLNSMVVFAVATKDLGKFPEDSPERATNDAKALETLQLVLDRTDAASKTVRPQALYAMAYIHSRNKRNNDAAKLFYEIADKHPDYQDAFNAIYNAVISLNTIIQDNMEKGETVSMQVRQDLVKYYRKMYSNPEWVKQDKAQSYMFGFGWQLYKLADMEKTAVAAQTPSSNASPTASAPAAGNVVALLEEAVKIFEQVAPNQTEYMEGRYTALEVRQEIMRLTTDASAQRKLGDTLVKLANAYNVDAGKLIETAKAAKKDTEVMRLREWSALSELVIAAANYEVLSLKDQAMASLSSFGDRWADTGALKESAKMLIQYYLLANKTAEAAQQVKVFREKYPKEAAGLIKLVIKQLQKQIKSLRNDAVQLAALNSYRRAYYDFAKVLYDDNKKSNPNATAEQTAAFDQMLADATLELGQALRDEQKADDANKLFATALKSFETCKAQDDKARAEMLSKFQMKLANQMKAFQTPGLPADVATRLGNDLLAKDLPDCGIDTHTFMPANSVKNALQDVQADPKKENVSALQKAGFAACQRALKQIEKGLPIDPVNLWGLARANRLTKNYAESFKWYSQLKALLNKDRTSPDYWQAALEYCEASNESLDMPDVKDKAKQAASLCTLIKQLRSEDPNMGGLKARFGAIEALANGKK